MLIQLSWKNIWRNKLRSFVILFAIALGILVGLFNMSFYYGMVNQRINSVIKTEASHLQLHHPKYLVDPDLKYQISDIAKIEAYLKTRSEIEGFSSRSIVNGMVTSAETGAGVKLIGIKPLNESRVTDINKQLIEGTYLEGIKRNPILIGEKLAKKLNVKLRSKVVVTFQSIEGNLVYASFRVVGIFKTNNTLSDEINAFVLKDDLVTLAGLQPDHAHETAILLSKNESLDEVHSVLKSKFTDLEIKSWREIIPEVGLIEASMDLSMYIFMGIILLALLFGIINTMLMAVLERTKEIGMLMAVGMSKVRVFKMILLETALLSLTGGLLGILMGSLLTLGFAKRGIDLSVVGEAYGSMGYATVVYPQLKFEMVVQVTVMVLITSIIASILPARKALKLNPSEAIRME